MAEIIKLQYPGFTFSFFCFLELKLGVHIVSQIQLLHLYNGMKNACLWCPLSSCQLPLLFLNSVLNMCQSGSLQIRSYVNQITLLFCSDILQEISIILKINIQFLPLFRYTSLMSFPTLLPPHSVAGLQAEVFLRQFKRQACPPAGTSAWKSPPFSHSFHHSRQGLSQTTQTGCLIPLLFPCMVYYL